MPSLWYSYVQRTSRSALGSVLGIVLLGAPWLSAQHAGDAVPARDWGQLLRERQYATAELQLREALKRDPKLAEAWFYLGLAVNGLGRTAEALQDLRHALQLDAHLMEAAEAGAQLAYRHHDPAAGSFLQDVLRLDPANATAHAMLTVLALEKPNCAEAVAEFERAGQRMSPESETTRRVQLCRANLDADAGNLADAERILQTLLAATPQDISVAETLADVCLREKQPRKAISILIPLKASLPAAGLDLLAGAYVDTADLPTAVEIYRESIARDPRDADGYLDLAILSMEHQSPEVAMSVLNSGLEVDPHSSRLLVARGTVYAQLGKDDLAQKDFEQADRLSPNSTYGTLGLGVLLREDGNLGEAESVLENKLKASPESSVLSYMLADVLVRQGASPGEPAFTRAIALLHTALRAQPTLEPAHALLGKLLLKEGDAEEATRALETAIQLQPTDRTALNQLVAAYRRTGRIQDAERVSRALEASVATERAQENEKNRVHFALSGAQSTTTTATDNAQP